jgi:protein ImuB
MLWHALRFPGFTSDESDPLDALALEALRFTSRVSLQPPHGLLLETGASLAYFGGAERLLSELRSVFAAPAGELSIAWAPTPAAAWLLASWRDGSGCFEPVEITAHLAPLPGRILESAQPHLDTFEAIGLRRIGQLVSMPRAGLARRFGEALLDELDRALGTKPDLRKDWAPAARFERRIEFPGLVESVESLTEAASRLLAQLALWLEARRKQACGFTLLLEHEDSDASTVIEVGLANPSARSERFRMLLRERLAVARLPAATHAIRLRCEHLTDAVTLSGDLFPDPASQETSLLELVEKLQARLGTQGVIRLHRHADHRPEQAWQASEALSPPARTHATTAAGPVQQERVTLPRPLWLLDSPVVLVERLGRPCREGPLVLLAGPERIECGWWDGKPVLRDYFIAEDTDHRMYWIYRERAAGKPDAGWFMQGRFG